MCVRVRLNSARDIASDRGPGMDLGMPINQWCLDIGDPSGDYLQSNLASTAMRPAERRTQKNLLAMPAANSSHNNTGH